MVYDTALPGGVPETLFPWIPLRQGIFSQHFVDYLQNMKLVLSVAGVKTIKIGLFTQLISQCYDNIYRTIKSIKRRNVN